MTTRPAKTGSNAESVSPYVKNGGNGSPDDPKIDRNGVRNILLSELANFRSSISAFWGRVGRSAVGNLWGFFAERGYGIYFRNSPLRDDTVRHNGFDYGRIFLEAANDSSRNSPSWSFDLPKYAQKMLIKSECSSINYGTETGAFTAGLTVTGGTSGATAKILEVFDEGTEGTLILTNIDGTFVAGETVTDTSTGSATVTKNNVGFINTLIRIYGVGGREVGGSGVFRRWGAFDLWCPMRDFLWLDSYPAESDPETIPGFCQEGFRYTRYYAGTGTYATRVYQNGAWRNVSTGASSSVITATHTNSGTGEVTYAHGLGTVPSTITFSESCNLTTPSFSNGTFDGTNNKCIYGGGNAGTNGSYCIYVDQGAGWAVGGAVTDVDETNITITWTTILGSPSSSCNIIMTSFA